MTSPEPRFGELAGRVAIVTGGARGIGRGIAERLLAEGMRVALADVDGDALTETLGELAGSTEPGSAGPGGGDSGGTVLAVKADLSTAGGVDRLFDEVTARFQTVDLLVNNAADLQRRGVLDEHRELLDLQLATNVSGPYLCSQRAAALMQTAGAGAIVNISSVGGLQAHHNGLPYDVTKGAVDAMTRAMAIDLGRFGIRVNAVAPGVTHTRRPGPSVSPDSDSARTKAGRIPLRRIGTVNDIAAAVAFLASTDADYITGQVLYVDGGITAQLSPPDPHAF